MIKTFRIFFVFQFLFLYASSQTLDFFPYSYQLYQQINRELYNKNVRLHTTVKPILADDTISLFLLDSLSQTLVDTAKYKSWLLRKLFNEHLVEINQKDFHVSLDFLPDFQIGRDIEYKRTTWLNTRGIQVQGNVGRKFSFYTSIYENQGVFPAYLASFIRQYEVIPGIVNDKFGGKNTKDWAWASAIINYMPNKYFSFTLGQDKNFIGDGYRSMLLSDVASNYPFFKIATTLGNIKYVNIWAQFQDLTAPKFSYDNGFRKKWGAFHYLDWNVNNKLSLGFFEAIIWQEADENGRRGFDMSYLNPIIFYRAVEGYNGSPDNALLGFSGKYKFAKNLTFYGQFMLDEFTAKQFFSNNGYWANKWGLQAGVKGFDVFKVRNLNFTAEFNTARPYTYSHRTSLLNYGHYNQPLAHPFGANFREFLSIWNYTYKRWSWYLQGNYARYGLDPLTGVSYGKDILKSYNDKVSGFGNHIGQGVTTNLAYLDGRVSFLLNPQNNLHLEMGIVHRLEKNILINNKTNWVSLGLRSSFRNLYQDF